MAKLVVYSATDVRTFISTGSDINIDSDWQLSWDAAHDAATGTLSGDTDVIPRTAFDEFGTPTPTSKWKCERGFLYFDTSALGAGWTITAAILTVYVYAKQFTNAGHADLHIVEGVQDDPAQANDFGDHLLKVTSGGSIVYADIVDDAFNDITLNATGRGWINKTGTTKFCVKVSGDIDDLSPSGVSSGNAIFISNDEPPLLASRSQAVIID